MSEDGPRRSGDAPSTARLFVDIVRRGGDWDSSGISDAALERAAYAAFAEAGSETPVQFEMALLMTDDTEMRALNRTWRGKDTATNVLSFPAGESMAETRAIGDVVVAYETAHREAEALGTSLPDHVSHLVVHGVFHLFGYDHETDSDAEHMEALEGKALATLGIANPYTGRQDADLAEVVE